MYADNKVKVQQHMKEYAEGKHTFTLALNKFADLTSEEFARGFKGLKIGGTKPHKTHQVALIVPGPRLGIRTFHKCHSW